MCWHSRWASFGLPDGTCTIFCVRLSAIDTDVDDADACVETLQHGVSVTSGFPSFAFRKPALRKMIADANGGVAMLPVSSGDVHSAPQLRAHAARCLHNTLGHFSWYPRDTTVRCDGPFRLLTNRQHVRMQKYKERAKFANKEEFASFIDKLANAVITLMFLESTRVRRFIAFFYFEFFFPPGVGCWFIFAQDLSKPLFR